MINGELARSRGRLGEDQAGYAARVSVKLPPLPPIGGQTSGRSVLDVLAQQHDELEDLCRRLAEGGPGAADGRVAQVVSATLSKHLSGEQQYLYPAVRQAVPDGELIVDRELAADRDLLTTLQRLETAGPAGPLAAEVTRAVRRHIAAATEVLMPLLAQMVPVEDLIRIGNRLETAEEAAPTRPHPATPSTPPWNKVVEPLVAVVDKTRDALSGRITRPDDL